MKIIRDIPSLRGQVRRWRGDSKTVGLIPTMGSLHAGHLSLVRQAKLDCDFAIATIFVNPTQFAPSEDFDTYPRDEARDIALLEEMGTDLLFSPDVGEMYADGFSTSVSVSGLSECLCGAARPHFFGGVATVVSKLLLQSLPDRAYFGEKDFQQLQVIKRMAQDLDIPVDIRGVPTMREDDGLAMSSRNKYLSPEERSVASTLYRVLQDVAQKFADGANAGAALAEGVATLRATGFDPIDYLEIRDSETFEALKTDNGKARVFVAAHLGGTRLIDNAAVPNQVVS
ncbi:MAG: pantoate--beta-alanine ligase [Rhodospirillaceae bacterium]|jgi:pantoate--beta-alanine ligase|nr:pantoate--beta-alanine ligase [Rhodospirillaceae bacterium]MBT5666337.1 pantoate--beta-alanine ligase [Rhodospirillaceae bacterium]MBT5812419.1 pantoate--beta-alanine ligase [Rhodospirillaceae bacterium]